jgi:hypothetical protein
MKIANVPPPVLVSLKASLDQFLVGVGRIRLTPSEFNLSQLNARGGIAEAQLSREDLDSFLSATGDDLDAYFTRLRVFFFDDENPIGSVGLLRTNPGDFVVEHVSLGAARQLVDGLGSAELLPESSDCEARLLQVPEIYLSSIVLVRNHSSSTFLVLTPPYPEALAARTPTAFRQFVQKLLAEHQTVFPPS